MERLVALLDTPSARRLPTQEAVPQHFLREAALLERPCIAVAVAVPLTRAVARRALLTADSLEALLLVEVAHLVGLAAPHILVAVVLP